MIRILYAEDNSLLRQGFERIAEFMGHQSVIVDDAARAWELIRDGERFDLIVSDNDMPEMNGLEFLKKVRSNPSTKYTPFVLFTGNDSVELKQAVIDLRATFEAKSKMRSVQVIINEHITAS
jgi:two-component system chemotaxis response regulator CheY